MVLITNDVLTQSTMTSLDGKLSNLKLVLDDDSLLISDDDENDTNNQFEKDIGHINSTEVINETRSLLHRRSSSLNLEETENDVNSSYYTLNSLQKTPAISTTSILGTKHIKDALPVLKDMKCRKSVRFDMNKNETCEIVQPELASSSDSSDSESNEDEETEHNVGVLGNVLDATDLMHSESSEESDNDNKPNKESFHTTDNQKDKIDRDIKELEKQKKRLEKENRELHERHTKEMKQLREEYHKRRDSYYDELDEAQREMQSKWDQVKEGSPINDEDQMRKEKYMKECEELEEKQQKLKKKKEVIAEQEKELEDYQKYLNRRHTSLTEKEEDLCILQDELEELSDILKDKEKELKTKQNQLELNTCQHDDAEIERTRLELLSSSNMEEDLRKALRKTESEVEQKNDQISSLTEEVERLKTKIKHLESHLTLVVRPSSNQKRGATNLRHFSGIPLDERTGEYIVPRSQRTRNKSSPRSEESTSSPVHSDQLNYDSDYSFNSPSHKPSPRSPLLNAANSPSYLSDTTEDGDATKSTNEIDESKLYENDTTSPTRSMKPALSKTCRIM